MKEILTNFIKDMYGYREFTPLHAPVFRGNEKKYVNDAIDTTYVSSVGKYVDKFEEDFAKFVGAEKAIAIVNGTCALHLALKAVGVQSGDEVITQNLTFIATTNAIIHAGAAPVFIDVDESSLGMSANSLKELLEEDCVIRDGMPFSKSSGRRYGACVPMHTFGHPCDIIKIAEICNEYNIALVEDAAEAVGSYYKDVHCGLFGKVGVFSFNGNKTITAGGGGAIVTNDRELAKYIKHISTTAKIPDQYFFNHDDIGYNYRMPNLNAALLCAQLENLPQFLIEKRHIAEKYKTFCAKNNIKFIDEPENSKSNFWLNAIVCNDIESRDEVLKYTNASGVQTRAIWGLMNRQAMFKCFRKGDLKMSEFFADRVVNLPSGVR